MRIGHVLRCWRRMDDVSIRDAARQFGTSAATLSRVERGEPMDGKTLAAIMRWLLEKETR